MNPSIGSDPRIEGFESISTIFPAAPPSVAVARHFVHDTLDRWTVPTPVVETARLLTSELVTNSYRHARCDAQVTVVRRPDVVRVEVRDAGGGQAQRRSLEPHATDGRGLNIVDALATRWGTTTSESGTLVWFELQMDGG